MSSVRGGGSRGRGRGNSQATPNRGRGSSSRGRVLNNSAPRGSSSRVTFGQPSREPPSRAPRGGNPFSSNGSTRAPAQPSAFGVAKTRGSWQERYQSLMTARERERSDAIRAGLIADPDHPRSLAEAITPTGTCQDMCAEYERVQRVVQKDVWNEETNPNQSAFATTEKEPDESRMVKKFRRAAAGLEEQLPSDLRPPHVLKKTCDYLFNDVIGNAASLASVHHFVWDRTRAIRNDFSILQVTRPEELRFAIDCYERIARFHIMSLHQLALPEKPYSKYDWQQEREQLDRTLLSLMQYYDDSRSRIELPNEAEFRAYCVIFQLQDPTPDLDDRVQTWPNHIIQDGRVQKAVDVYMAACNVMDVQGPLKPRASHLIARQDWERFWTLVASKEVSYLMACVAEIYFNLVRRMVLNALFRTFRMNSSLATPDWTTDILTQMLAFDEGDEVYTYCERFGFSFKEREDGQQYLDLTSVRGRTLPEPNAGMPKQTKTSLVEDKRSGRTLPAVINGFAVKRAQDLGLVNEVDEEDESMEEMIRDQSEGNGFKEEKLSVGNDAEDDGESLFIPETKNPEIAQAQSFNPFLSGPKEVQPSMFSRGQPGTSTFGKPSMSSGQPSIFAQRQDSTMELPTTSAGIVNGGSKFQTSSPAFNWPKTAPKSDSMFDFLSNTNGNATEQNDSAEPVSPFTQRSTDHSSIFAKAPSPSQGSSFFSFGQPAQAQTSETAAIRDLETPNFAMPFAPAVESKSPSPEPPKSPLTFGQPTGIPAAQAPSFSTQPPETKVSQPHLTPTSPTLTSTTNNQLHSPPALGLGARRSSSSTDTKPKKPSPLSNSIIAGDPSSALVLEPSALIAHTHSNTQPLSAVEHREPPAHSTAAEEFEALITRLADELLHNPISGLLKQYIEFAVSRTVAQVYDEITTEQANEEAEVHRQSRLCRKYGRRWRDIFWQRRLAKTGRERRERRQRRLQQRESQETEGGSLYDLQSELGRSRPESRFEDHLAQHSTMGIFFSRTSKQESILPLPTDDQPAVAGIKRPASSHETDAPRQSGHKRLKSTSHVDDRGRITKLTPTSHPSGDIVKRSSFHNSTTWRNFDAPLKDTTNSTYFRLKALGVSQAVRSSGLIGRKRPRSESFRTSAQISSQTSPPALRPPSRLDRSLERSTPKALMPPPSSTPSRALRTTEDDEALFARLKAARESLREGAPVSPPDSDKKGDDLRRSASSQCSRDSPSMAKARLEARLRASQASSANRMARPDRSVPAYRNRFSRFVPREDYGKAIERARENRESRSRDPSRPESRFDEARFDAPSKLSQVVQSVGYENNSQVIGNASQSGIPNGSPEISAFQNGTNAFGTSSKPFTSVNQVPVSFTTHTTQLSSENRFLHAGEPQTFGGFAPQPTFGSNDAGSFVADTQDHTIHPTQIHQSLASTFGKSPAFGHTSFKPVPQYSPTPPQQDSYLQSQAISLLSDDEDDEAPAPPVHLQGHQRTTEMDEASEELLDEATDDDANYVSYIPDPHALQMNQHAQDEEDSQGWDSQFDDGAAGGQMQDEEEFDEESGEDINGYASEDEEDDEAADGDIDEQETEDADDDDADDFASEEGEDEDDGGDSYPPPGQWQPQMQGHAWASAPPKTSGLQDVGNSAEEAIELSD